MTRRSIIAACVVAVVTVAAAFAFDASRSAAYMTVSEVLEAHPMQAVTVGGRVVSSRRADDGVTRLVIRDESEAGARLELACSGQPRMSFGVGVIVIARGRLGSSDVFEVDDFIRKGAGTIK